MGFWDLLRETAGVADATLVFALSDRPRQDNRIIQIFVLICHPYFGFMDGRTGLAVADLVNR